MLVKGATENIAMCNIHMPVRYKFVECVRLIISSPLSIIHYVGLYVFSLPISLVMIERIYLLCLIIIIKSEVWTITHCLELGHETMVSAVCISIFLSTFSALLALCAGDFTGHRWISHTKSSDAGLWCLICAVVEAGKQWRRWWFESPSRSL